MFSGGWCSGMGAGGWILMITFWAALLGVIVWAVIRLFPTAPTKDALDRRPAPGDIDPDAYREVRAELLDGSREE
jgi:putative membrane protein